MTSDLATIRRDDVQDILASFFRNIDMRSFDPIAALFEKDASYSVCLSREDRAYGNFGISVSDRDELVGYIKKSILALAQTHHMFGNLTTSMVGDRVKAAIHIRAYHKGKGAVAHLFEESLAIADVEMKRSSDGLKITTFDYTVLIIVGSMDVFAPQD